MHSVGRAALGFSVWFSAFGYHRLSANYPRPGLDHTPSPEVLLDQNFRRRGKEEELPCPHCLFPAGRQMTLPGSCLVPLDLTLDCSSRGLAPPLDFTPKDDLIFLGQIKTDPLNLMGR